uniref:Uncharacterized protein n=1 Tax=Anopheles christyi TaxID=43041 RepID=A0A182K147_9DIPT
METIQLFKAMGQRVAKLPPAQQNEIIDSVLQMIDASQKLHDSAALTQANFQRPARYNLSKSVSQSAATLLGGGASSLIASPIVSSPSCLL